MSSVRPGRRFEVMAQRGGRWLIDCLAASEVDALARAEQIYADESTEAVRIMRAHFNATGRSFETQIMERVRAKRGAPPLRLAATPDDSAWCESIQDFFGPSSRYAISRLLRNFLDRFQITPTELLYNYRWIKQLDNQESLLPSAIQRMAALQAKERNLDRRIRVDAIDAFVNEATARSRDALASRTAPKLHDPVALPALAQAVAARTPDPVEQRYWLRYGISRGFEEMSAYSARFEAVMSWVSEAPPPALLPVIDEMTAGLMGATSMIKDTLGHQPHLGAALHALADLASGRHEGKLAGAPPGFPALAKLMAIAGMPETRSVLHERLQREIALDKPLSRDDKDTQRRIFETLLDKLADGSGLFPGGAPMIAAIARRTRRFEIIGGVEEIRLAGATPAARLDELFALDNQMISMRQQQSLGTYLRDVIEGIEGDPAPFKGLAARIAGTGLPEPMKRALTQLIPSPTPTQ